jgi:hypothetical protein
MWREDSTRSDLQRLANALGTLQTDRPVHRTFRIKLATIPPPVRPRFDAAKTQRIVGLRR